MLALVLLASPSSACGGFFCSGTTTTTTTTTTETLSYAVPVEQSSERILFCVNGDGTVTTLVEVAYVQSADVDFGWVIPIPEPIDPLSVTTASADLFNLLEVATAPRFTFTWPEVQRNYNYSGGGGNSGGYYSGSGSAQSGGCCGGGKATDAGGSNVFQDKGGSGSSTTSTSLGTAVEEVSVEVIAEAVVGPFEIQVITATDAAEFAVWLDAHGYDFPDNAITPLQHYVDRGMAYLGVRLSPDVPEGPIDTLEFTYPAAGPMIPLILTSIAASSVLPMQVYIASDEPYRPSNWAQAMDLAPLALPDGYGGTDYLDLVHEQLDVAHNGLGMELEYAQPTSKLGTLGTEFDAMLASKAWITRWRGSIRPDQMVLDPEFGPDPKMLPYSNEHVIELDESPYPDSGSTALPGAALPSRYEDARMQWLIALPFGLVGWWRRSRGGAAS